MFVDAGDNSVIQWNAATGEVVKRFTEHTKEVYVIMPNPFDPRLCASAGYDGKLVIMNLMNGTSRSLEVGGYDLLDGKWTPDGQHLVVTDVIGTIHFYDVGRSHKIYTRSDTLCPREIRPPEQQFLRREFKELVMDDHGNVVDKELMLPMHKLPPDYLGNVESLPYDDSVQEYFRSRYLYYNLPGNNIGVLPLPPRTHNTTVAQNAMQVVGTHARASTSQTVANGVPVVRPSQQVSMNIPQRLADEIVVDEAFMPSIGEVCWLPSFSIVSSKMIKD